MSSELLPLKSESDLESMLAERAKDTMTWSEPTIFDLSEDEDKAEVQQKLVSGEVRHVVDRVDLIAGDLYEHHNPGKKNDDEARRAFVQDVISQGAAYGKWVHFPWSGELVRYPDVDDHRALRTSRNRNLITAEEQQKLYDSTIAVFGLSVGSNVVDKLVTSGVGGKIIMGDPDHIEPSNLNRIHGTFTDVGTKKLHLMGRKISETDPYLEQVHFTDGFTEEHLEELKAHQPDIIFDEVDNLQAKAAMRVFAQEQGIPLVMATDLGDRSVIDVERYDLGKTRPFVGRLKDHEFSKLHEGNLTPEEVGKFMLKIVGVRHVTTRMLDSVMKVGETLPGMPQLGATAAMGGALATIAAREILLGRELQSGRYVCSPKKILELAPQASLRVGLKTVAQFVKSRKQS